MYSEQACGSAEVFHAKYNSIVNESRNKAHHITNYVFHEQGAMTSGCIKNIAKTRIKFLNKYDWSGNSKNVYPRFIARCCCGDFVHSSRSGCDAAAVVYSDECGAAWLLAWSVKYHCCCRCGNCNKVYVETGPLVNYIGIDWSDIKDKLDASRDISYYVDECNGNEAFAKICSGTKATVVAIYNSFAQ